MKTPAPTLFFYAVATFLLAGIAFAALGPLADADSATRPGGIGPYTLIRIVIAAAGVAGLIGFGVAGISRSGRA